MENEIKQIWMYWENKRFHRKPDYLELCLDTIHNHKGKYNLLLLNEKTVQNYINVPKKVRSLVDIAHKADYIRFHLLYEYGGVWLDSDTILLRDIEQAVEPYIDSFDFVGFGREFGKPSINFMASQKNCQLLEKHIKIMDPLIQRKKKLFGKIELVWTEIGHDILWPLAEKHEYHHHEFKICAPIFWKDWELFFKPVGFEENNISHETLMVMLYNDFMYKKLKFKKSQELLNDNNLLAFVFGKGLA